VPQVRERRKEAAQKLSIFRGMIFSRVEGLANASADGLRNGAERVAYVLAKDGDDPHDDRGDEGHHDPVLDRGCSGLVRQVGDNSSSNSHLLVGGNWREVSRFLAWCGSA
jgi:hypothetical protein